MVEKEGGFAEEGLIEMGVDLDVGEKKKKRGRRIGKPAD